LALVIGVAGQHVGVGEQAVRADAFLGIGINQMQAPGMRAVAAVPGQVAFGVDGAASLRGDGRVGADLRIGDEDFGAEGQGSEAVRVGLRDDLRGALERRAGNAARVTEHHLAFGPDRDVAKIAKLAVAVQGCHEALLEGAHRPEPGYLGARRHDDLERLIAALPGEPDRCA